MTIDSTLYDVTTLSAPENENEWQPIFWNNNNILYLHLPDYKYEKHIKECWPRKFDTECLDVMMTLSQSVTETLNDLQSLSTPKDPNSLTHFLTEMHKNYV